LESHRQETVSKVYIDACEAGAPEPGNADPVCQRPRALRRPTPAL